MRLNNPRWQSDDDTRRDSGRGVRRGFQEPTSDVRDEFSRVTLRIEKHSDRGITTIRLTGRMQAEHVSEVDRQIGDRETNVILDLEDVSLVDVQVVRFLGRCETRGIELRNCSPYITEWIARERR